MGLNSWASIDYLHRLGWEFVGGEQVPWPSSLARGPYGWAQVATFVITGLLILVLAIAVRDELPRKRASSIDVILLGLLGVALILAAFRVDTPMLRGGNPDTWHGWWPSAKHRKAYASNDPASVSQGTFISALAPVGGVVEPAVRRV